MAAVAEGRSRSVRALRVRATIRCGWEQRPSARPLDPARRQRQPPFQDSCGKVRGQGPGILAIGHTRRVGGEGLLTSHGVLAVCRGPPIDTLAPAEIPVQPSAKCGQGEQDQQEGQGHGSPSRLFSPWSGPSGYPGRHCRPRSWGNLTWTGTTSRVALPTGHLSLCPGPTMASRSPSR